MVLVEKSEACKNKKKLISKLKLKIDCKSWSSLKQQRKILIEIVAPKQCRPNNNNMHRRKCFTCVLFKIDEHFFQYMLELHALKVLYIENVGRQNAIYQSILIVQYKFTLVDRTKFSIYIFRVKAVINSLFFFFFFFTVYYATKSIKNVLNCKWFCVLD